MTTTSSGAPNRTPITSGTDHGGDDCYNIVWSTKAAENIVSGTNCSGDYNIVWCTAVVPMSPVAAIRRSSGTTSTRRMNHPAVKA